MGSIFGESLCQVHISAHMECMKQIKTDTKILYKELPTTVLHLANDKKYTWEVLAMEETSARTRGSEEDRARCSVSDAIACDRPSGTVTEFHASR